MLRRSQMCTVLRIHCSRSWFCKWRSTICCRAHLVPSDPTARCYWTRQCLIFFWERWQLYTTKLALLFCANATHISRMLRWAHSLWAAHTARRRSHESTISWLLRGWLRARHQRQALHAFSVAMFAGRNAHVQSLHHHVQRQLAVAWDCWRNFLTQSDAVNRLGSSSRARERLRERDVGRACSVWASFASERAQMLVRARKRRCAATEALRERDVRRACSAWASVRKERLVAAELMTHAAQQAWLASSSAALAALGAAAATRSASLMCIAMGHARLRLTGRACAHAFQLWIYVSRWHKLACTALTSWAQQGVRRALTSWLCHLETSQVLTFAVVAWSLRTQVLPHSYDCLSLMLWATT